MQMEMTTPKECKRCLDQLEAAVEVKDQAAYADAVAGLKNLQFLLCQQNAVGKMMENELRDALGMEDGDFFKYILPKLMGANAEGADDFFDVFPGGVDDAEAEPF